MLCLLGFAVACQVNKCTNKICNKQKYKTHVLLYIYIPWDALHGHDEVGAEVEPLAALLQLTGAHEGGEVQPRL